MTFLISLPKIDAKLAASIINNKNLPKLSIKSGSQISLHQCLSKRSLLITTQLITYFRLTITQ